MAIRGTNNNLSNFVAHYWRNGLLNAVIESPVIHHHNVTIGATLTEAYRRASDEIHPPEAGKQSYYQKQFTEAGQLDADAKGDARVYILAAKNLDTTLTSNSPIPKVA